MTRTARPRMEEAPPLKPGDQLVGRYTVLGQLGKGGMGVVYAVYDAKLDRRVALKLLRTREAKPEGTTGTGASSGQARLLREAKAMARLNHPHVVSVYDTGTTDDGGVFVAMELVEGVTLSEWLRRESRGWEAILDVFVAAGRGLGAAHAAGMVHRDFKPDNVLVGSDGRVRVTDFGVVRLELEDGDADPVAGGEAAPIAGDATSSNSWKVALTQAGTAPGTPRYMAPEIYDLKAADARSDLFAFCVALHEALYGVHPFVEELAGGNLQRNAIGATTVPPWVLRAIDRGLAAKPGDRPQTMDALLALLERPSPHERTRWLAFAGMVTLAAALSAWGLLTWRTRAAERAQLCQGGPRRFDGVWDAAGKARVRAALLATGRPYAEDAWHNVEATLDRYAARWADMHRDSCAATRLRGEQTEAVMTLRMACLDRRLQGFAALTDVLAQADGAVLDKAGAATAGLASLEPCADVPALMAEVPPPADPAARARGAAVRKELATAEALRLASRMNDGAKKAAQAVEAARVSGDRAALTEALATEGQLNLTIAPDKAATRLTEAFWSAYEQRLDRTATAAAMRLTHAYTLTSQFDRAAEWQRQAEAGLKRIDGDEELEAELLATIGYGFDQRGKYGEALEAYARAARISEHRFGANDLRTLRRENDELTALTNAQRVLEARGKRLELLARQQQLLGPVHPVIARTLMDLGDDEVHIGLLDQARAHLGRAERIYRDAGAMSSRYWMALKMYESVLGLASGRPAEAEAAAREALATLERGSMQTSEEALELRGYLGRALVRQGQATAAAAMLQKTLQEGERVHGRDGAALGFLWGALAEAEARLGHTAEARRAAERTEALALKQAGPDSVDVAEARAALAPLVLAEGHAAEALALVDRAEPALVRAVGELAPTVTRARRTRGEALAALGRTEQAVATLTAAADAAERAGVDPAERQAMRTVLARVQTRSRMPHAP